MAEKKETSKILTIGLVIVLVIAAIVLVYVNLPQDNTSTDGEVNDETTDNNTTDDTNEVLLTVTYNNTQNEYTLEDLESIEQYTGSINNIKLGWLPEIVITGPTNYTGVRWSTLVSELGITSTNYSLLINATDGSKEYNQSMINGNVDIYNESGNITGKGSLTFLIAYKEENEYITEDGPILTIFVDDGYIVSSRLKFKYVTSMEVI